VFTLPTFNLGVNIWRWASIGGKPDVVTVGNLARGLRGYPYIFQGPVSHLTNYAVPAEVLLPALTDVRDSYCVGGLADLLEIPAGSGRTYAVLNVDDAGKGFTNEHRVAVCVKYGGWPVPIN
jgi:hypothetical protein